MKKALLIILTLFIIGNLALIGIFLKSKTSGSVVFNLSLFEKSSIESETGFVSKVIDGDTVIINGQSVRLLGMDTDERGEKCYKEAKERLEEFVLNKKVELEKDVRNKDQYDRLLRWIFIEDENGKKISINLVMVEEGLAIARFYEDKKYKKEVLEAEKEARANKIGCKWRDLN